MPDPTAPTPIVMAWSGGKDSMLALDALRADARWRVVALVASVTRDDERVLAHGVRNDLLRMQANLMRLPIEFSWHAPGDSKDPYEVAWANALARVQTRYGPVSDIAYGDLFLADVRAYRDAQCNALGWTTHYPLWGQDTGRLAERFIAERYQALLTCVDTTQLDAMFVGRSFTQALLDALPDGVDPCGERGEFHTFVNHAPSFSAPIRVAVRSGIRRDARFEYAELDLVPESVDSFLL
jgi:uncharacterized protein (TIGR00290 family)